MSHALRPTPPELFNRRWRDTLNALAALEAGILWHPLTKTQWRIPLQATLDEIEGEFETDDFV